MTEARPRIGSIWRHKNGNLYKVLLLTNEESTKDQFPITVVYVGPNLNIWSRTLSDWSRSMTYVS